MIRRFVRSLLAVALTFCLAACAPTPVSNVLGYMLGEQLGTLDFSVPSGPGGSLSGTVRDPNGQPIFGATVLVAERNGNPHAARTDAQGRYRIDGIPPGQYTPAAVAPGYQETVAETGLGFPRLVTIRAGAVTEATPLRLQPYTVEPLPEALPVATNLTLTATETVTAPFPAGAAAQVQSFRFVHKGVLVDTLRLYLPLNLPPDARLPLLFMIYPIHVDYWQAVSTAFAAQGYAFVAISPMAAHGTEIIAHAEDARVGLELARQGALSPHIDGERTVILGGSFSSAILYQLLRMTGDEIAGWVTVGGISNAFAGAADFYAGKIAIPPEYKYLIPSLGPPHLYPLAFLRYSPVYAAAELPPTLLIHTDADLVIPIEQARQFEATLRAAGIPVDVFYYEDVSHYLQIDENTTEAGRQMFYRVVEFAERILE